MILGDMTGALRTRTRTVSVLAMLGAAIDACRVEAPRIAERVGAAGVAAGRTSHRLRNPANAPEPWMVPPLDEFRAGPPQPGAWRSVDLGLRGTG